MSKGVYIIVALLVIFFGTVVNYSLISKDKLQESNNRSYTTGTVGGYIGGSSGSSLGGHK